jgi:hypothetical protein
MATHKEQWDQGRIMLCMGMDDMLQITHGHGMHGQQHAQRSCGYVGFATFD